MPMYILKSAPYLTLASEKSNKTSTSLIEQDASYMILNGLRAILVTTHDIETYLHDVVTAASQERDLEKFMAIMIVGLFLVAVSLGLMVSRIANTDRINKEIL